MEAFSTRKVPVCNLKGEEDQEYSKFTSYPEPQKGNVIIQPSKTEPLPHSGMYPYK